MHYKTNKKVHIKKKYSWEGGWEGSRVLGVLIIRRFYLIGVKIKRVFGPLKPLGFGKYCMTHLLEEYNIFILYLFIPS